MTDHAWSLEAIDAEGLVWGSCSCGWRARGWYQAQKREWRDHSKRALTRRNRQE